MFESETTVPLTRPYTVNGQTFDKVVLRAPKMKEYLALGGPAEWQPVQGGGMMYVEYLDRIEAYLDRLVVSPGMGLMQDLDLPDTLLLKRAVTGFFTKAEAVLSKLTTASSSDADAGSLKSAT